MKYGLLFFSFLICAAPSLSAQPRMEDLYSDFSKVSNRLTLQRDLQVRLLFRDLIQNQDSIDQDRMVSACDAMTQFQIRSAEVRRGLLRWLDAYDSLQEDSRRSLLQAIYSLYPSGFEGAMEKILSREDNLELWAIAAMYLHRSSPTGPAPVKSLSGYLGNHPQSDTIALYRVLVEALQPPAAPHPLPSEADLRDLFSWRASRNQKTVYCFLSRNRDLPGIALVQEGARFLKEENGSLLQVRVLGRSAANFPYFLKNGNSPAGIYRIRGTAVSHNHFIGPTPTLQLALPFEIPWKDFFAEKLDGSEDPASSYANLFPPSWKKFRYLNQTFIAGQLGRIAILAHGSTLDPEFFRKEPYYPLTPASGCLSVREIWNPVSGRLLESDQWKLIQAFPSGQTEDAYFIVLEVCGPENAPSPAWIKSLVDGWHQSP